MAVNYTVAIAEAVKSIFGGIMVGELKKDNPNRVEIVKAYRVNSSRFRGYFPSNIFQDEYAILYSIFYDLNIKFVKSDEIRDIINTSRDLVLDSPYVDRNKYTMLSDGRQAMDDDIVNAIIMDTQELCVELSNMYVSEEEFDSACKMFSFWYRNQVMSQTINTMGMIMSDSGTMVKGKGRREDKKQGIEDTIKYYNSQLKTINELSSESRLRQYKLDSAWYETEMERDDEPDRETMFSLGIPEIDNVLGEFRRGNILGILGPPKGGKTRFSNFIVHRALSLGYNVCVWPIEGQPDEWIANQVACTIADNTHSESLDPEKRKQFIALDSKMVLQKKYRDDKAISSLISEAKLSMATSEKLGRLSFIEDTAYVEDFLDILDNHYNEVNPFDVLVIDSLVNIMSRRGQGKAERISEAYIELKSYLARRMKVPALGVMPAQLKQDVVDHLRRNPNDVIDVTAGGESAETIRTPDTTIGLFSSETEKAAMLTHMYSVASRHSQSFKDFTLRSYLGCCYFCSKEQGQATN